MKLNKPELEQLFYSSIENAQSLLDVAINNLQSHISLGISEIALEELGKSFSCLAQYGKTENDGTWSAFWKEFKNHKLKAHRGFFYEFFSPFRFEIENNPKNNVSNRQSIPGEKEVSFYVDFDKTKRVPIIPNIEVEFSEIANRVFSILGPLNTALTIKEMFLDNSDSYKQAFSDFARFTLEVNVFQQDVPKILESLGRSNIISVVDESKASIENAKQYDQALSDIYKVFTTKIKPTVEN